MCAHIINHLVANCLMLQNVLDMSQAIRDLIEEGYPVTRQTVQGLSAYLHGHIRRYGDYELEVEDVPPPISEEALTTVFERIMQGVAASFTCISAVPASLPFRIAATDVTGLPKPIDPPDDKQV